MQASSASALASSASALASQASQAKAKKRRARTLAEILEESEREGWPLSTDPTSALINANKKRNLPPIDDDVLVDFFEDYLDSIYRNIDGYLTAIKSDKKETYYEGQKITTDGFDKAFKLDDKMKIDFNLAIYKDLFTQFAEFGDPNKKDCGRLNGGPELKLNKLISYIGKAVLRLAAAAEAVSQDELKTF